VVDMVDIDDILGLFRVTEGKLILFLIFGLYIFGSILIIPQKVRKKNHKTNKDEIVYNYDPIKKKNVPKTNSYPIFGIFFIMLSLILFGSTYLQPRSPDFTYDSEIILGNESNNLSSLNYDRLNYFTTHFLFCKRTVQDTPSRWDIDDTDVGNNRNYFREHDIIPSWDAHLYTYQNNTNWTILHIELYFSNNGIGALSEKHTHDYEFLEVYFYKNETQPRYLAFPTTEGISHPRKLLEWEDAPLISRTDKVCLLLDADTNSVMGYEDYGNFPQPNDNYKPTLTKSVGSNTFESLTHFQKTITYISYGLVIILGMYMIGESNFKRRYFILLFILLLIGSYNIITLQYDFIGNPSLRVWQDGEHFDGSAWYESESGRAYIEDYGGLPYNRDRWATPEFESQLLYSHP
jgi:hypothetical protein